MSLLQERICDRCGEYRKHDPDDAGPFCVDCEAKRRHYQTLCAQYLAMQDYLKRGGTLEDW